MASIDLVGVRKRFDEVEAIAGLDLHVADGTSLAVLGPSGSGKSTLLRVIAGLETPDEGDVHLDGVPQGPVPAHRRPVAIVFQHFALYPHLSALENITLGLRYGRGLSKADAEARARKVAERLEIHDLLDRRPKAMSGGQRQRVALARAMSREAGVVLLDEPMSGLDAQLRLTLRIEIARLLRTTGATTVHVTHDQLDAMAMADRIAVMRDGRIEQLGDADDLYERPATAFVAGFVGSPAMNLLPVHRVEGGHRCAFGLLPALDLGEISLGVRPDQLSLSSARPLGAEATVVLVEAAGADRFVHLELDGAAVAVRCPSGTRPRVGTRVPLGCEPTQVHVFDTVDGRRRGMLSEFTTTALIS